MTIFIFIIILLLINNSYASINFCGLDSKNLRNNYKEKIKNNKNVNLDKFFLEEYEKSNYKNINAITISTSRYFYNYRHTTNLLIAYNYLKTYGDIIDKNLILMTPYNHACESRNINAGNIYVDYKNYADEIVDKKEEKKKNLYKNLNVDYSNDNVRYEQIKRILRHRYDGFTPYKNRLYVNEEKQKNLFIYLTGHGGKNYLKIQEFNIISTDEFSLYIQEILIKNYYKYIFVIIDTCQGYSFYDHLINFLKKNNINNVFLLSSSNRKENSFSYFSSDYLSVSTVDRFTYNFFSYLENIWKSKNIEDAYKNIKYFSLRNALNYVKTQNIMSEPTVNESKFNLTSFLHDKNVLFYNSNVSVISKDIYNIHIQKNYTKKTNIPIKDFKAKKDTCIGSLYYCNDIKKNIYKKMLNLYEDISFYNDIDNYLTYEEDNFLQYYFTFSFNKINLIKLLSLSFQTFIILFLLFLMLNKYANII